MRAILIMKIRFKYKGLRRSLALSGQIKWLIDEAWEKCPPPESIDFRMSFDRDNKYRVES